jgi:hypothetical protein
MVAEKAISELIVQPSSGATGSSLESRRDPRAIRRASRPSADRSALCVRGVRRPPRWTVRMAADLALVAVANWRVIL